LEVPLAIRGVVRRALHVDERRALLRVKIGTPFDGVLGAVENWNGKVLNPPQQG